MSSIRSTLLCLLPLVFAACVVTDPGGPTLPGRVDAPPPPMAAVGDSTLTNVVWSWQGTQPKSGARIVPDAVERYTLNFQPGGSLQVRADCNRGSSSYLLNGSALTFGPIALTKMMCPSGSRDTAFLQGLGAVTGHSFAGNELVLTLQGDSGSMRFTAPRQ